MSDAVVSEFVTLDGVMGCPGGSADFGRGGSSSTAARSRRSRRGREGDRPGPVPFPSPSTLEHGLVDGYRLMVLPVVPGRGNPLSADGPAAVPLRLVATRPTGAVAILRLRPE